MFSSYFYESKLQLLGTSITYRHILKVSLPIMIGSAVQNGIALSDSIFLLYYDETDFAAIALVSIFYLIISAIGYGFSKGGQILVARQSGMDLKKNLGNALSAILGFQILLSLLLIAFIYAFGDWILSMFIDNPLILNKCSEYLFFRSWSMVFSYTGLGFIAFYTGISRTVFIMWDVLIMLGINLFLNYLLIFGQFGFPEMGIKGAGLASAIAECIAFVVFLIYFFRDKERKAWRFFLKYLRFDIAVVKKVVHMGFPVVTQMVIGLGSWFVFFSLIEGYGERALAISNVVRIVYLFLSIPCWGFSSGINTLASFLIGQGRQEEVLPTTRKTVILTLTITLSLAIPILTLPGYFLSIFESGSISGLIVEAEPILRLLILIISVFCIGGIYYNGLVGTGDTWKGLYIQLTALLLYFLYLFIVIKIFSLNLLFAWTGELFFWMIIILITTMYLRSGQWQKISF